MKSFIAFRLRKELDSDLYDALKQIPEGELADLCRQALRRELGINKVKVLEVREVPLPQPKIFSPKVRG